MTLGTLLLNLRHEHNLSQKDVAAAVNVAQSTYCDWESDKHLPKIAYIRPLAALFKVKEEVLLHRIYGQNAATETELHRLKTENEYLRQRDAKQEETIQVLENTIKKLSQTNSSNGKINEQIGGGNTLIPSKLKKG
jgi:transcriptional regulator with XRE-family HTH domain